MTVFERIDQFIDASAQWTSDRFFEFFSDGPIPISTIVNSIFAESVFPGVICAEDALQEFIYLVDPHAPLTEDLSAEYIERTLDFAEICHNLLEQNPGCGIAFVTIDPDEAVEFTHYQMNLLSKRFGDLNGFDVIEESLESPEYGEVTLFIGYLDAELTQQFY